MTFDRRAGFDGTERFWTPCAEEADEQGFIITREGVLISAFGTSDDSITPDESTYSFVMIGHHGKAAVRNFAEQYMAHMLQGADTRIDSRELEYRYGRFQLHGGDDLYPASWGFADTAQDDPQAFAVTTARRTEPHASGSEDAFRWSPSA